MLLRTVPLNRTGSCGMAAMRPRTSCAEARHPQPHPKRNPALREGTAGGCPRRARNALRQPGLLRQYTTEAEQVPL